MTETDTAALDTPTPLDENELRLIDAYWRAANYLSVAQIYLLDNPLLRERLRPSTSSLAWSATSAQYRASICSTRRGGH